jgi:tRNA/tmRNA/rRNA uracil-C5-methylase (TrmA/RlmC/RlmD family)
VTRAREPDVLRSAVAYFASRSSAAHDTYAGASTRWRVKAKLAARTRDGGASTGVDLGLFRRGTHELVPIETCAVSHEAVDAASSLVRDVCAALDVRGYDEEKGRGELRYVQFVVVDDGDGSRARCAISLVFNSAATPEPTQRQRNVCEEIARRGGDFVHGVHVNLQNSRGNVIFNNDGWRYVVGERMTYSRTPAGRKVYYLPGSFMQANAEAYTELLRRMPKHVPVRSRVVELYAGVGAIGYSLVENEALEVQSVRFVESSTAVAEAWERTRNELPTALQSRVSLQISKAERIAKECVIDADVLIVDPPRKGLDEKLRAVLTDADGLSEDLRTILYVSCGFDSFMRDADELMASGMWRMSHHESFIFFPGSNHLEVFAVFSREP